MSKDSTMAKVDATRYWSIVSGLWYLIHTQPNIAFTVGEDHWAVVKRLLPYVKGTVDQGVIFPKTGGRGGLRLTVFSDVDIAGDIDGRKSTSGALLFLGSDPIPWQSLKQKVVALSTCEAEYVAAAQWRARWSGCTSCWAS